ncbi:MAG: tetratricopeptide repeat protein [Victivallaceae bacterium]|nr:tetratricopeptide repeat protein [Victivallaceae bacterium]
MDIKDLKQVSQNMRDVFERAKKSSQNDNPDYAIELLCDLVSNAPGLLPARELLREYEVKKSKTASPWDKIKALVSGKFSARKCRALIAENPLDAMRCCEEHLTSYLFNRPLLEVLVDAALAADANFIAQETLEVICSRFPDDDVSRARLLELNNKTEVSAAIPQNIKISETEPADLIGRHLLSKEDLEQAIVQLESELAENDSFEIRRQLGDYCCQLGLYDKAVDYFQSLMEEGDDFDPAIDKYLEKAMLARWNEEIVANPGLTADIEQKKFEYRLERAKNRVELYPNDSRLHYELGELYFQDDSFDVALEEFEHAKENPVLRIKSNLYIGRCFVEKYNFSAAIEPFAEAINEMTRMEQEKMEAMYYLGKVYEELGMDSKALEMYKEIYRSDISFMDVASRIEELCE